MTNKIIIGVVLFYTLFFSLMGIIPQSDISFDYDSVTYNETGGVSYTEEGTTENLTAVYQSNFIYEEYTWSSYLTNFLSNIFVNISGMPIMINILVFSPLLIFSAIWLITFILKFVPWLG